MKDSTARCSRIPTRFDSFYIRFFLRIATIPATNLFDKEQ